MNSDKVQQSQFQAFLCIKQKQRTWKMSGHCCLIPAELSGDRNVFTDIEITLIMIITLVKDFLLLPMMHLEGFQRH